MTYTECLICTYNSFMFVSLENDDGIGPLKPALSIYLQLRDKKISAHIKHRVQSSKKEGTDYKEHKINQNTHSSSSLTRFPNSEGREPFKLFVAKRLKSHKKMLGY